MDLLRRSRSPVAAPLAVLAAALLTVGLLGVAAPAPAAAAPASPVSAASSSPAPTATPTPAPTPAPTGVNPSPAVIRGLLHAAAVKWDIPPKILYAIAWQESGWRQFKADGSLLVSGDGGVGIMQVTPPLPAGVDATALETDIAYNIDVGASILDTKWYYAPTVFPVIGDGSRNCYEDWFFAVWAYNGWVAPGGKPNPYPYLIWDHIADGCGLWAGQPVTAYPKKSLVAGFPAAVPVVARPEPEHWWSPVKLPKPTLSAPHAQKRVAADRRFTVSGTLSPQHPAGAHFVTLAAYHWNGRSWTLQRTLLTTNRDAGGLTRWSTSFSLGAAGRWKLVAAAPADEYHSAGSSKPAFVTVLRRR